MQTRAIHKEIVHLALPSILANITIPLVGIVDVAIIGHISDAAAVGGIAVGTMLFDLLYWNFGFLRVGTSGMTAQAYGRGRLDEQAKLLKQGLTIAAIAAAAIWLIQWLFVTAVLWLMPCSTEVADFARHYFFVRIWAAPATLALMALKGWFIGMQNTVASMVTDIVVNVTNMVASYLLAVYTPLGAIGVAWGTLLAQYSGLAVAALIVGLRYRHIWHAIALRACVRWTEMKRLVVLNGNLFLRSLCFMVVYVGYTALMSRYGDNELAVSAIFMKIYMVYSFFIDGFAYAAEAVVGKSGTLHQAVWKKTPEVNAYVRALLWWAGALGLLFSALYLVGEERIVGLMTSDEAIRQTASAYYIYLWTMPALSTLAFLFDGIFIGATDGKAVRNCMVWAAIGFVAGYAIGQPFLGAEAVYIGYMMHLIARSAYLTAAWLRIPTTNSQPTA